MPCPTPSQHRFCAVDSQAIGEPLAGTATHAESNLLISWHKTQWLRNLRSASNMSDSCIQQLQQLSDSGRRVNLIHRNEMDSHTHQLFLFPEKLSLNVTTQELLPVLSDINTGEALTRWPWQPVLQSLLLCCTHGKKDKCCAKFGFQTYKALRTAQQQAGHPVQIWESTHLGGCRLAASLISFPSGRKYGRIEDQDVSGLFAAEIADTPYLPCYRGYSLLNPLQQCAEVAARNFLSAKGVKIPSLNLQDTEHLDNTRQVILPVDWHDASGNQGSLKVRCVQQQIARYDTCADYETGAKTAAFWEAAEVIMT